MGTRKPAVAGQFYPASKAELEQTVQRCLNDAHVDPAPGKVVALVVPHAGYVYSGPTAGFAYARARSDKPKCVVLLGCSHRYQIDTASVFDSGGFEIPLGTFPVDEPLAATLARELGSESTLPHLYEHSLEVQLPFLWLAIGPAPIVPILFGSPATGWHEKAGETLARLLDEDDLVVASTDLSHYMSDSAAHQMDKRTLDTVLNKDCAALCEGLAQGRSSMCGGAAVVAAMAFARARNALAWSLLDYRTSAAASGDYGRVVGYAAISMEREP